MSCPPRRSFLNQVQILPVDKTFCRPVAKCRGARRPLNPRLPGYESRALITGPVEQGAWPAGGTVTGPSTATGMYLFRNIVPELRQDLQDC